ncbi:MAG: CAP domain-containing protein [Blastocatellia bacterium]|nr:CAP domain-containing protein [Blastocatellia bacterium]
MRMPIFFCALLLSLTLFASSSDAKLFYSSIDFTDNEISRLSMEEYRVYDLVNRVRAKNNLNFLIWDERLAAVARSFSSQMASAGFFKHQGIDGKMVQDRANEAGIRNWRKIGENLFYARDVDEYSPLAVRMWMESDSHRENILDRGWTAAAVGIAVAEDGKVYVTHIYIQR